MKGALGSGDREGPEHRVGPGVWAAARHKAVALLEYGEPRCPCSPKGIPLLLVYLADREANGYPGIDAQLLGGKKAHPEGDERLRRRPPHISWRENEGESSD